MKNKFTKLSSILLAGLTTFSFAACGGDEKGPADEIDANYQWATQGNYDGTAVLDSSEIANYPGKNTISLMAWNTSGTGNFKKYNSTDDVVTKEIKRITGVSIDSKKLMDNAGSTAEGRYNNLDATGKIPDIAYGSGWLDTDEVWDLTNLIDTYCPTIKARMPQYVWSNENVNGGKKGKVYGIPYELHSVGLSDVDIALDSSKVDKSKTILFEHLNDSYPYIYVREDILKDAYPDALTTADINRIYAENGAFTEDQLFDIKINSAEEFRTTFLDNIYQAIQDGGDKYMNGNRQVTVFPYTAGSDKDTWDFLGKLVPNLLGAGANSMNSNFSYWDVEGQKLESMLYQDFYKEEVQEWVGIINEGKYVRKASAYDNSSTVTADLSSGNYAIGYLSNTYPAGAICTWKGEKINYRKVYLNIPVDTEKFLYAGFGEAVVDSVKFLKSEVSEDELPQLLRWLDYQCSRSADMLYAWGPDGDNALFTTDANGVRTYKDTALADQMVFSTSTLGDKVQKYNLANGDLDPANPIFSFYYQGGSIYHPKATYDISSMSGLAMSQYSSAVVMKDMQSKFVGLKLNPSFHTWTNSNLAGIEEKWAVRDNIEDQLAKLLNEGPSNFDTNWGRVQTQMEQAGWTKSFFNNQATQAFLSVNAAYLYKFYKK